MKNYKIETFSLISALMIVLMHSTGSGVGGFELFFQCLIKGVTSIAVPFFFCVSGYMLAKHISECGWWRNAVRKRLKTIVLPYLIWNAAAFCVLSFVRLFSNVLHHTELIRNIDSPWVVLGLDVMRLPENGPLWYLRTLMLLIVVSPLLVWLINRSRFFGVLAIVSMFCLGNVLEYFSVRPSPYFLFVRFFLASSAVVYFLVGILLRIQPICLHRSCFLVLTIVGLAGNVCFAFCIGYGVCLPKLVTVVAFNLMNALLLPGVWGLLPEWRLPRPLVSLAMPIYVEHMLVLTVLGVVWQSQSLIVGFIKFSICLIVCVALTKLLKRKWPRLAGVVFGGR